MTAIPIHNETNYSLTTSILNQIERDAIEYFGESIQAIRIQYGIERHAFNAKTGEVRYAFSPSDFGLVDTAHTFPEAYSRMTDVPSIDDERTEIAGSPFEEVEGDDEETPDFATLEDDLDVVADNEGPEFQSLDTGFESLEEAERNFLYDDDFDS